MLTRIEGGALAIAAILIGWVSASIFVSVLSRFFFDEPMAWTIELSEYALLFLTFFAIAPVASSRQHITLELIPVAGRPRLAQSLDAIGFGVSAVVSFLVGAAAVYVTIEAYSAGTRMRAILSVPRWLLVAVVGAGLLWFGAEQLRQLRRTLAGSEPTQKARVDNQNPSGELNVDSRDA